MGEPQEAIQSPKVQYRHTSQDGSVHAFSRLNLDQDYQQRLNEALQVEKFCQEALQ